MPDWLWWLLIPAGLYALHRFACWMESRGWIYWTRSGNYSTRAGNAMLELQQIIEPSKRTVIEMKADSKPKRDEIDEK